MKKMCVILTMMLSALCANAFEFDGIELNNSFSTIAQEISKRGYNYDNDRNCLKGNCQGTEIFLSMNYVDVKKQGKLGQLVVEVPTLNAKESLGEILTIFNVVYHQVSKKENAVCYQVDKDGTQLEVSQKGNSIFLTYNTPYYRVK